MTTSQTLIVLAIMVGCFAVLGPKIIAPMLFQSYDKNIKPGKKHLMTILKFWAEIHQAIILKLSLVPSY